MDYACSKESTECQFFTMDPMVYQVITTVTTNTHYFTKKILLCLDTDGNNPDIHFSPQNDYSDNYVQWVIT